MDEKYKKFVNHVPESRKHEEFDSLSFPELEAKIQEQENLEKELEYILEKLNFTGDEEELTSRLEAEKQEKERLSCDNEIASDDADMVRLECEKIEDNIKYYTEIQTKRKELEEVKTAIFNLRETIQKRIDNN